MAVPSEGERKTILIVDDEAAVRDLLRKLLEGNGYAVLSAADGQEGLFLAREHRPALVILDIMMDDMDGTEVRSRLRDDARTSAIPIIYLTGLMTPREAARMTDKGGDVHIAKPFDANDLLGRVRQLT